MRRREFLLTSAALGAAPFVAPARAVAQSAETNDSLAVGGIYQAGSKAQLFIDQMIVRSTQNVAFTLHPARKHPDNPLVRADQPWEGWALQFYGNVIFDRESQRFKMWYLGEPAGYFDGYATCYAESRDGIHWQKPPVGTLTSTIPCRHNAVCVNCEPPNVFKDPDDPDPSRRYKMIAFVRGKGYGTLVSPDGLNWTQYNDQPICAHEDVIGGFFDRQRLWVALAKNHAGVVPGLPHARRIFSLITSSDFKTWTVPELVLHADARDDAGALTRLEEVRPLLDVPDDPNLVRTEFYGVGIYQAESCVLGFPWVFTVNNNGRFGNHEGPGELQLAVTRDLKHWERPFRTPCVPRGDLTEWDSGFFVTGAEALRVGDEVWLYYGGTNGLHGTPCFYRADGTGRRTKYNCSIGLAIWPLDRFVSADGPAAGGTLATVPLNFTGRRLELNVNAALASTAGNVRVELLNAAGSPIAGFGLSDPICQDSLRHTVTWSGSSDVSALRGGPVSLRFRLLDAELYSFAFRE